MRYGDAAAYDEANREDFFDFGCGEALIVAFAQMVVDAVVTPQHQLSYQAKHLFGAAGQHIVAVYLAVQTEEALDLFVGMLQHQVVELLTLVVKFLNLTHDSLHEQSVLNDNWQRRLGCQ